MSTQARTTLVMALAFAIAVGTGALLSVTIGDDGDSERALPESGPLVPVVGPADGSFDAAPSPDTPSGGTQPAGGSGAAADSGSSGASDPIGVVEEYDVGDSAHPRVRFVDPCTDGEGGDCDGVASTVLSIVDAPPFDIRYAGAGCNRDAQPDPHPLGWLVQVNASTPGDFVFTLTDSDDPTNVRTASASTSAAHAAEYEASDSGLPFGVFTCVGFDLPNQSNQFILTVDGQHGAETDSLTTAVSYEGVGGRPPVQVDVPSLPHEDQLHVVVPSKHGDQGSVQVTLRAEREELGVGGPNLGDVCPRARFDAATRPSETSPVPAAELAAPDYAYDQGWDHRYENTFTSEGDFAPGSRYELCIFWLDGADRIQEKLVYPIVTPNRYTVFVRVKKVSFTHAQVPSSYTVTALNDRCTIRPGGDEPVRRRTYADGSDPAFPGMYSPPGSCNHEDGLQAIPGSSFAAGSFDPMLRVEVHGHGRDIVDYLQLPRSSCARRTGSCGTYPDEYTHATGETTSREDYVISLGAGSGGGLCGSSFGDCDPPRERVGTITVRVILVETDRQGGMSWSVGPSGHVTR